MIDGKKSFSGYKLLGAGQRACQVKNYKPLLGKPLFMWSVEAAVKSSFVDEVFISTNCLSGKKKRNAYQVER